MARPLTGSERGYARPEALVSTEWLAERLGAPDVRIVDGSWYLPAMKRDPKAEFLAEHIPGAVYFDIDEIADTDSPLPHMLPSPEKFAARVNSLLVRELDDVKRNIETKREQVIDARSPGRFFGRDPEPRQGLRSGHIPGSKNVPYGEMTDPATGTLLPAAALEAKFRAAGVDPAKPIVASCGSGVSACALALGLHLIGARQVAVYDGSWSEWGGRADTPVEKE